MKVSFFSFKSTNRTIKARLAKALDALDLKLRQSETLSAHDLDEVRALHELLDARHRYAVLRARPALAVVSLLVIVGVAFLFSTRAPTTSFSAEITGPSVHLHAQTAIEFSKLRGRSVRMAGIRVDSLPIGFGFSEPNDRSGPDHVISLEGEIVVQSVAIPDGGQLSFLYNADARTLHIHHGCAPTMACLGGQFLAAQYAIQQATPVNKLTDEPKPLRLLFVEREVDLSLRLVDEMPFTLFADADIDSISFLDVRETTLQPKGSGLAWSGVQGGELRLPSVDRTITVEPGEWVRISGSRLRLARLTATDSALSVTLRGDATELEVATGGHIRSLKPTRMELLVAKYQQRIHVTWVIVAFGLLIVLRTLSLLWGRIA